jgi:D-glycero-alpha-D-manno-heptose-7-phosphate kinase
VWSLIETVKDVSEIKHPSVKACLQYTKIEKGVEIHYDADLPARTGLGSSSSFTVGLLNALYALKGKIVSKEQLAKEAIHIEQEIMKENVGCQDQVAAAFGGFNLIEFSAGKNFIVIPITLPYENINLLESSLMLVFTGFARDSSVIAKEWIERTAQKKTELRLMYQLVYEAVRILTGEGELNDFGRLLNETWKLKRSLTNKISTSEADEIYSIALKNGALGGKLLGAGGGGFMLIFAPPENHSKIKQALSKFLHVPFKFDTTGSQIVYYSPEREYE